MSDIDSLLPILAPATFFDQGLWPGPHQLLRVPGLGLTWGFDLPGNVTSYLTHDRANELDRRGIDWRAQSLANLAARSDPVFSTGVFERTDGKSGHLALIFMHEDGLGPSRLLFAEQIGQFFPQGWHVAMPEMSCGLAIATDVSPQDHEKISGVIDTCYKNGTRPLVLGMHDPGLLVERQ
jgi:hypothetical protein